MIVMKYILFSLLIISLVLSGCVEKRQTIEKITEYQIIDMSIQHQENAFLSSAKDYISVFYLDENGAVKQQKDSDLGGLTIQLGNRTKFEKYEYIDENGNSQWFNMRYILTVTDYSLIKDARDSAQKRG